MAQGVMKTQAQLGQHVSETAFGPTDEVFFHEWVSVGGAADSNSVGGPSVNLRAPPTPTAPFQRIDLVAFGRSSPSRPMTFIQFGILQFVRHGRSVAACFPFRAIR